MDRVTFPFSSVRCAAKKFGKSCENLAVFDRVGRRQKFRFGGCCSNECYSFLRSRNSGFNPSTVLVELATARVTQALRDRVSNEKMIFRQYAGIDFTECDEALENAVARYVRENFSIVVPIEGSSSGTP